mgnify:CR=1 FL=1
MRHCGAVARSPVFAGGQIRARFINITTHGYPSRASDPPASRSRGMDMAGISHVRLIPVP